jgi:sn-glycerol 3-phosphate transport system permease protein
MIWSWIMEQNSYGLLNAVLGLFKVPPLRWLNSSKTAMLSVVIVSVWKSIGYYALVILSALKAIPAEIFEAAELDNAPKWRVFFRLTLPLLSPQLFFLLIVITINSFKVFDTIRIMTGGGPGSATDVLAYYIYRYAFQHFRIGYASAAGTVLMVILMIFTALYFAVLGRRVHYQQ